MDVCLGRRSKWKTCQLHYISLITVEVLRDVKERGRDIDGIMKQWFSFVKPSYVKYVEPQRHISGQRRLFSPLAIC
jgi:hypothetical protein